MSKRIGPLTVTVRLAPDFLDRLSDMYATSLQAALADTADRIAAEASGRDVTLSIRQPEPSGDAARAIAHHAAWAVSINPGVLDALPLDYDRRERIRALCGPDVVDRIDEVTKRTGHTWGAAADLVLAGYIPDEDLGL